MVCVGFRDLCDGKRVKEKLHRYSDYKNEGYDYRLKAYMNVVTKEKYSIDSIQEEIKPENRIGTLEQLEQGIVAAEEMVQEVERTRVRGRE